jgi:hypothetical protein
MLATVRIVIASTFLAVASLPAAAGVITLTAIQDAGLRGDQKNSTEGLDDKLLTRQSDQSYALVQFDLSGIAAPILAATLRMEWHVSPVLNQGVQVWRFNLAWNETTVTWNNANGGSDPLSATIGGALDAVNSPNLGGGVTTGTFAEWDITSAAVGWQAGDFANHGVLLQSFAGATFLSFHSSEAIDGGAAPQLLVSVVDVSEPVSVATLGIVALGLFAAAKQKRCRGRN